MAKSSTSRKGKSAWRKNLDISDIEHALAEKREREILHGDDDDFVIDTVGDQPAKKQKVLSSAEILRNKSKIPAQGAKVERKIILKKRVSTLMSLARKTATANPFKERMELDGILRADTADVWGEEPVVESHLPNSAGERVTPTPPETLREKPLLLTVPHTRTVPDYADGGKSYNPALDDWKELVDNEGGHESSLEIKRQNLEEYLKRIQHLIDTLGDDDLQDMDEGQLDQDAQEVPEENKYKLSINPPTRVKIKTRAKRNKMERHKERLKLQQQLKKVKKKMTDIAKIETVTAEVDAKLSQPKEREEVTYERHGKYDVIFKPIEIKLFDELTGNLRQLRPEGNLLYDQLHKLQVEGKVEAASQQKIKPKRTKYVLKHGFKD
ncbi:P60-like protein [Metschnikowia bicuspidata]|uniref:Ribosome biogenesis protein NOP53 n=1 Tax=Metschnikowia bicuspidata TaxID=27322 RepID=A0A4P9ZGT4_9ASCO|nr:P60-like protein [Metschnikowia bicuspidata]